MPALAHSHWDPIWAARPGGRHPGQLPRRRRLDGHHVRGHRRMGWMTNFAKVSSLIFMDNMRCIGRPDLRRRVPPLPRARSWCRWRAGAGWLPAALETFDWQWRNGGAPPRAPRSTTCCRASTSAARSTAASGSRSRLGARGDRAVRRTTSCSRPTTRTRPASTPGPQTAGPAAARLRQSGVLGSSCPTSVADKILLHDTAAGVYKTSHERTGTDRPRLRIAGSSWLRPRGSRAAICASTASSAATPSPRTCTGAIKRAAVWSDPAGRARRRRVDRHRQVVRLRRRHGWQTRRSPRSLNRGVGQHRPLPVPAHRSAAASSWIAKINGLCHAGGLDLALLLRHHDRRRTGPVPHPRAAARHPRT